MVSCHIKCPMLELKIPYKQMKIMTSQQKGEDVTVLPWILSVRRYFLEQLLRKIFPLLITFIYVYWYKNRVFCVLFYYTLCPRKKITQNQTKRKLLVCILCNIMNHDSGSWQGLTENLRKLFNRMHDYGFDGAS